jgi:hypothetical protein
MRASRERFRKAVGAAVSLAAFALFAVVPSVQAEAPEFLLQIPPDSTAGGSGAGSLDLPRGMASDQSNGHLYIADRDNHRIDEFTAWGSFVKAWGWDVAPDGASGDTPLDQLEICTAICQGGSTGHGAGQLFLPRGITVDAEGAIYVYESPLEGGEGFRIQKFGPDGGFIWMIGGGVNQGPLHPGNLCTAQHIAEGDTCGAGVSGTGDGEFSDRSIFNYIAYNPSTGSIFVGDFDRIQEFDLNGTFKGEIEFAGAFDGKSTSGLAADPKSGDLYVSFSSTANVYRIDPVLSILDSDEDLLDDPLPVPVPAAIVVDVTGNVFVADYVDGAPSTPTRVLGFDEAGNLTSGMTPTDGFPGEGSGTINGLAALAKCPAGTAGDDDAGTLYIDFFSGVKSYAKGYGLPPLCFELPPAVPPEIKTQFAVSVGTESAVLKAQINPKFWPDTTYLVQYGTSPCSAGGCTAQWPIEPSALTTKSIAAAIETAGVALGGLAPGTTYHYRFVAQSGGGGPTVGQEQSFTTFRKETAPSACSSDEVRAGPSKQLPDCRAYELISPLEKNSADVATPPINLGNYPVALNKSARLGQRMTYSAGTAFFAPDASPYISQYLSERGSAGWKTKALAPPRTLPLVPEFFDDNEFWAFSEDLCSAWLRSEFDPPLAAGAAAGYRNLYRRENCSGDGFETISVGTPPHVAPKAEESNEALQFVGAAADSRHSIFVAPDNLPGTTAPTNTNERLQLYEHLPNGELRFVCILPDGSPSGQACYAGTSDEPFGGRQRQGSFQNAISRDGSRIFWTESSGIGPGRIFVRIASKSTTKRVSQSASPAKARFLGAAADGSRAVFAIEDVSFPAVDRNLYTVEIDTETETLIAPDVRGVLGMSDDARRVYFASTKALPGVGPNSEGREAVAGKQNIYFFEQGDVGTPGSYAFVGTLDEAEASQPARPSSPDPFFRTSRVSPDGLHAAFMSTGSLTGYDNTDAISGEDDAEVFLYDAPEDELRCISCNPTGARPIGIDRRTLLSARQGNELWQAAQISTWERPFYATRALSNDGNRLFFESWEALVPRDSNGTRDVYQWEAEGHGSCNAADWNHARDEGEATGGCVDLISSGKSPRESVFLDADATGDNVFFLTLSSLVPPDYGLVDVYDARVAGGFRYPEAPPPCEGEACQSPPPAPEFATPASRSNQSGGNIRPKRRCPKGKRRVVRRGKARCVKKRGKQTQRHQGGKRR